MEGRYFENGRWSVEGRYLDHIRWREGTKTMEGGRWKKVLRPQKVQVDVAVEVRYLDHRR